MNSTPYEKFLLEFLIENLKRKRLLQYLLLLIFLHFNFAFDKELNNFLPFKVSMHFAAMQDKFMMLSDLFLFLRENTEGNIEVKGLSKND